MTELRQKMIRAMELKNLSPHTQRAYLAAVTGLRQTLSAIARGDHQRDDRGLSAFA